MKKERWYKQGKNSWENRLLFLLVITLLSITSQAFAAGYTVNLEGDSLSVYAEDASLTAIFQEIAHQGDFELTVDLGSDKNITIDFNNLSLENGIRTLHSNTIIIYGNDQINKMIVGTDRTSDFDKIKNQISSFLEEVPELTLLANVLSNPDLEASPYYNLYSEFILKLVNDPDNWRENLVELSNQITPEIRDDILARVKGELDHYVQQQGILSGVKPESYSSEHILVKFKSNITTADIGALNNLTGAALVKKYSLTSIYKLSVSDNLDIPSAVALYQSYPLIEYAEPDYIVHADATTPNDPYYQYIYAHTLTNTDLAWDQTTGHCVIVAVIDTGVQYTHPDLTGNMWTNPGEIAGNGKDDDGNGYIDDVYGIDAYNNDGSPMDDNGHGTHVAGTIGAVGNNAVGVTGVAWTCKIMALKFLDSSGSGYNSDAITCIEYAVTKGAHLSNNSWGGGGSSQALEDAVSLMNTNNIPFVASAGNDGFNNDSVSHYPSSYDVANVIAVAASDSSDDLATFTSGASNYGAISVDLAAPGKTIYSTYPTSGYAYLSGTSMATPYVSGVIALMFAKHSPGSDLTPTIVRQNLIDSCVTLPAFSGKMVSGGRLNTLAALNSVTATATTIDCIVAGVTIKSIISSQASTGKKDDCFIATASFGSPLAGPVRILSDFRDRFLLTTLLGREFTEFYYKTSPPAARFIADKPVLKFAARLMLWPLVGLSWLLVNFGAPYTLLIVMGLTIAWLAVKKRSLFLKSKTGLLILLLCAGMLAGASQAEAAAKSDSNKKQEETHEKDKKTDGTTFFPGLFSSGDDTSDNTAAADSGEKVSDIGNKLGFRLRGGYAFPRESSDDFFGTDDVIFNVDGTGVVETDVVYDLKIADFFHLNLGMAVGYQSRDISLDLETYDEGFGTVQLIPVIFDITARFHIGPRFVIFVKPIGLGYSFNSASKGNFFDDLEDAGSDYSLEVDNSFVYRMGVGGEVFLTEWLALSLEINYFATKPKFKVKEEIGSTEDDSSPEISLNSIIFLTGVNFYFDLFNGNQNPPEPE